MGPCKYTELCFQRKGDLSGKKNYFSENIEIN